MNSVFSEQILADKLSKLNNTQQCIETLSHWCIFHRKKAELVVATWDKHFHSSEKVKKTPLLYLANDILQNSKRNGNEFVTEFWKVLPSALKDVLENGEDHGKNVASRLVDIWEERKVFGSRARGLKDVMLGKELPPPLELNRKRSRSIRIVRRDLRSIKIKLSIGGTAEKVVSAFHSVLSEHPSEDADMNKCRSAVDRVRKLEKNVADACKKVGDPKRMILSHELEEEEALLKQCIEKLKSVEATRVALVSQLREALHEQESELENVRTQLQVAEAQVGEACNMRKRLNNETEVPVSGPSSSTTTPQINPNAKVENAPQKTAAAIAAEVADKLTASSSSQLIMSSVLSTFAAEAAKNIGSTTSTSSNSHVSVSIPFNSFPDSRPKLENPNLFIAAQPLNGLPGAHHPYQTVFMHQPPIQVQASTSQASSYHMVPNPNPNSNPPPQYMQTSGGVVTGLSYGYNNVPPQPHMLSGPAPLPHHQPVPLTQRPSMPLTQQPPVPPSFRPLQPPGMVYYTHPHPHHQH